MADNTDIIDDFDIIDTDGNFQPYTFANYVNEKYGFVTFEDNDTLYYYNNGVYNPNGKSKLREEITRVMGNDYTQTKYNRTLETLKGITTIKRRNFGAEKRYINVENGIIDIETGDLIPHGPDMQFLTKIPVTFDEQADCPNIKAFIRDIVDDSDVDLIQELFGYLLLRDYTFNKSFMLIGPGSNGKTTLTKLMRAFIGNDNVSSESLQDLLEDPYSKARLFSKMLNVDADISDKVLKDTSTFKKLTGEDTISAHRKYEQAFDYMNHAKLVFGANSLPRTRDDSLGFFRRWILVDFPYKFTNDADDEHKDIEPDLLDDLTTEHELSGLLNWALEGLDRLLEQNGFSTDGNAGDTKQRWIEKADTLAAFLEGYVSEQPGNKLQTQEFFEWYSRFCQRRGVTPHDRSTVGKRLQKLLPSVRKRRHREGGERVAYYHNISIDTDGLCEGDEAGPLKDRVLDFVDDEDQGDGVEFSVVQDAFDLSDDEFEGVVDPLLEGGQLFEPKPGRVKRL